MKSTSAAILSRQHDDSYCSDSSSHHGSKKTGLFDTPISCCSDGVVIARLSRHNSNTTVTAASAALPDSTFTCWQQLPDTILELIVELLGPTSRGLIKHVSKGFLAAVQARAADRQPGKVDSDTTRTIAIKTYNNDCYDGSATAADLGSSSSSSSSSMRLGDMCSSLTLMRWADEQGVPWDAQDVLEAAAGAGCLEVVQWAHQRCQHRSPLFSTVVCDNAANGGHMAVLKWATEQGFPFDEGTCEEAARGGHLETLQWLRHEQGCPWNEETCAAAAGGGHLKVLRWARLEGCPWDWDTCAAAAGGGHLELLRWARMEGCLWNAETCARAARGGHLELLRWARGQGCPWSEETCAWAAGGGHLDVLLWARKKGCPWDEWTCREAARGGHRDVLQWAVEHGAPAWNDDHHSVEGSGPFTF